MCEDYLGLGKTQLFNGTKLINTKPVCLNNKEILIQPLGDITVSWETVISSAKNTIFIADEDFLPMTMQVRRFESVLNASDCYFILITRSDFAGLAYSYKSIFRLTSSRKYGVKHEYTFNTFTQMYLSSETAFYPKLLITEDSGSGFTFFKKALSSTACTVDSAGGKDKMFSKFIEYENFSRAMWGVVDGVGFGSSIELCLNTMKSLDKSDIFLILPESFEYLLLEAGAFNCNKDWIIKTYNYCDAGFFNKEFPSFDTVKKVDTWEDFYALLLRYLSKEAGQLAGDESKYLYDKGSNLNDYYFRYCNKVLENLKDLVL